jgi:hypothetical protein
VRIPSYLLSPSAIHPPILSLSSFSAYSLTLCYHPTGHRGKAPKPPRRHRKSYATPESEESDESSESEGSHSESDSDSSDSDEDELRTDPARSGRASEDGMELDKDGDDGDDDDGQGDADPDPMFAPGVQDSPSMTDAPMNVDQPNRELFCAPSILRPYSLTFYSLKSLCPSFFCLDSEVSLDYDEQFSHIANEVYAALNTVEQTLLPSDKPGIGSQQPEQANDATASIQEPQRAHPFCSRPFSCYTRCPVPFLF